jgi:DNA-binding NarL/FixJ family response regulator
MWKRSKTMPSIKILIADDHKIVRDCLKLLINKKGAGLHVIAEAENGRKAVELARKLRPALMIMDVLMPDMNGIDAARKIVDATPQIRVIGLSMHSDRRHVQGMLEAGASGYLLKNCSFREFTTALRDVAEGKTYVSP